MSSLVRPTGSPYIGVGGTKRGIFFDPTIETGRMPGRNPAFERSRDGVQAVPRPGTMAEIQSAMNATPNLSSSETNHEFQSNFRIVHHVRDVGSKDTDRSWLEGHFVFLFSKVYAAAQQSEISPFEDPAGAEEVDFSDAFGFVMDGEMEDNYGAVRVAPSAYFNHFMDGEKKLPAGQRYPNFPELMHMLGISVGGIVNNQTGFTGPGYGETSLPARDLVNLCIEGDVKMIPTFNLPTETNGSIKGLKVFAIVKRMDENEMRKNGLPTRYVPDNGNPVGYPRRTGPNYPEKRFQVYFVCRRHAPSMSELEYTDDNGYLDRGYLIYIGEIAYYHHFPSVDPRMVVNDVTAQRAAGLFRILYKNKELEFCG